MQSRKIICETTVVYVVENILAEIVININLGVNKLVQCVGPLRPSQSSQGLKFYCHAGVKVQVNVRDLLALW